MANKALQYRSTPQFKKVVGKVEVAGGLQIGQVLDLFSKEQGVGCDGVINGLKINGVESASPLRLGIEVSGDSASLVARDCTGAIIFYIPGVATSASPSASRSPSPSISPSASLSPSSSESRSSSASTSPSSSLSPSSSASLSASPSSSNSPSNSPSLSPSASASPSSSPSPSA